MKTLIIIAGVFLLTACEKPIFKQVIGPENTKVGQAVQLNPGVEADSYVWYVEQSNYSPDNSVKLYNTYYEKNPSVQWDIAGQYVLHLTTSTNGKQTDYSGYILVN